MRARNVSRTHEFPRERVFTAVREFSREFPRRKERAFVRGPRTREHAAAWNTRCSLPGPFDQAHAIPQCEKPFFPPRDARTRAHAPSTKTTHRRRSSRARESFLHALKS